MPERPPANAATARYWAHMWRTPSAHTAAAALELCRAPLILPRPTAEWRATLAASDATGALLLAVGAVALAPLTEELFFRGYVLPALTKWMHPALAVSAAAKLVASFKPLQAAHTALMGLLAARPQVVVSAALFAAAHPPSAFAAQLLLGTVLGTACVAARGNLAAPLTGHALYNGLLVLGAILFGVSGAESGGGGGFSAPAGM
jgi:membrane protease YdiL (CAAX protease family)